MKLFKPLFFVGLIILGSCAQIVNPSGGNKDDKSPEVIDLKPSNKSTSFNKQKITVRFSEFIQLNSPDDQIVISPPFNTKPEFVNKGKSLEILIKDSLKPNTTYTLNFGNSIGDNQENNLVAGFSYVFSTGESIDSNFITGVLQQGFNNKAEKDFTIGLYEAKGFTDSTVTTKKPVYLTKTDISGGFSIYNLPKDSFKLIAFMDENKNLKVDKNEVFAYSSYSINTADSLRHNLKSFKPDTYKPGKIIDTFSNEANKLVCVIYKPYSTQFKDLSGKKIYTKHIHQESNIDSFYIFTANYPKDSIINLELKTNDTIHRLSVKNRAIIKSSKFTCTFNKQPELNDSIKFTFTAPVLTFDTSRIKLTKDSLRINYSLVQNSPFQFSLYHPWEEKTSYQIQLSDSSFTSVYQEFNKTDKASFLTKSSKDYATLLLHIKLAAPAKYQYIVQITDTEEKNILASYIVKSNTDINIGYVLPGSYQVKIIHDTNNNGIWDNGDFKQGLQPEKVSYHADKLSLKAYWDLEQSILIE